MYRLGVLNDFAIRSSLQVNHCAFSQDGNLLITGSDDGKICVWDIGSGKRRVKAKGHKAYGYRVCTTTDVLGVISTPTGPVKACAFSADSTLFASGSTDCTVRVWNTAKAHCLHVLEGHTKTVETVCFSKDSKLLASGSYDNKAVLWDPQATGSWDHTVVVWNVRSLKRKMSLQGHTSNVSCVAFSGVGMLASGSWDKTVRVWDPKKGILIFVLEEHAGPVVTLSFSPDAILLVTAAQDGKGMLDVVTSCQFSPFETLLIAGTSDHDLPAAKSTISVNRSKPTQQSN
ncbi:WD repeat-containing protein 38-like [Pristis pectinata]|uniref:WD repeat-containing protein 38-like n=1 Tax=Pristis pectinata TaxID=685728 RepID=UPI00223E28F6|nr:WD repeat-containing protein 38-like [Pristis pectinata]